VAALRDPHGPLDYRRPHGRTIEIAVSRLRSATPASRHGVLVLNLGGPGGAGLFDPVSIAALAPRRLLNSYDLVSFDPRGVGRSAPVSCGLTSLTEMIQTIFPWPLPGGVPQNAVLARHVARRCAARMGSVMPFITTANTARDIDRLRAARPWRSASPTSPTGLPPATGPTGSAAPPGRSAPHTSRWRPPSTGSRWPARPASLSPAGC